jgi:hypothetical protein
MSIMVIFHWDGIVWKNSLFEVEKDPHDNYRYRRPNSSWSRWIHKAKLDWSFLDALKQKTCKIIYQQAEKLSSALVDVVVDLKEDKCTCDSFQLFAYGHNAGCCKK